MAKTKAGLPDGFDIGVTSQDLAGPARLPDYLDDDPVLELSRLKRERERRDQFNYPEYRPRPEQPSKH